MKTSLVLESIPILALASFAVVNLTGFPFVWISPLKLLLPFTFKTALALASTPPTPNPSFVIATIGAREPIETVAVWFELQPVLSF